VPYEQQLTLLVTPCRFCFRRYGVFCFRPFKQAERGAQAKFSPKGRERDLARAPAGIMDVRSEHLLRQAPK
jgi:hypothetical protein